MRVIITAGGGGHFASALAVIESLPKEWEVVIVGRKYAFEADKTRSFESVTAEKLGIPFIPLTTGRLQRRFTRNTISSLFKTPMGFLQAMQILKTYKPDAVVSFGGYISVPLVLAASVLRVPIVLHEQTLHAGLANKVASPFATKVCISWDKSMDYFRKTKTVLTGLPLRKELIKALTAKKSVEKSNPTIYVTGGSAGSHSINVLIEQCLPMLLEKYTVIHQTGDAEQFKDYERLEKLKQTFPPELKKRYQLSEFVTADQMATYLHQADLVIARAGMGTVTELLLLGKPSLLIPLPYGQKNEQLENARLLVHIGLAEIADQNTLTSDTLYKLAEKMINHKKAYLKHAEKARQLIHLDAAERIIETITYAVKQKSSQKA